MCCSCGCIDVLIVAVLSLFSTMDSTLNLFFFLHKHVKEKRKKHQLSKNRMNVLIQLLLLRC